MGSSSSIGIMPPLKEWISAPPAGRPRTFTPRLRGILVLLALGGAAACPAHSILPDAPSPAPEVLAAAADPAGPFGQNSFPPAPRPGRGSSATVGEWNGTPEMLCTPASCSAQSRQFRACCSTVSNPFDVYLAGQADHIYTSRELGHLALKDVIDPFNLLTIGWLSGIAVASNSHSEYGPGFKGFGRLAGVSFTEDMTDEFVGTFLIPSIDHQDPHFHRLPNAKLPRRIAHAFYQIAWTQSQTGRPMFNYSTVVGTVIEEGVAVSYVPFQHQGWGAAAERVSTNFATDPIGNLISEFLPDVARRVNIHIVFVQQIINKVALEESGSQ
jgi:hypothetical protein